MRFLDLTLATVPENLALDEALLDEAEARGGEVLRLWESRQYAVILGRSSRAGEEANLGTCTTEKIPVLRRCSGGCAVVIGPGCLMYSVVLSMEKRPEIQQIDRAHRWVLSRIATAIGRQVPEIEFAGTSDLVLENRKFSGNSLRSKRTHLLYHGTILYDFDTPRISRCLRSPPREPSYREGRTHDSFVGNMSVSCKQLRCDLQTVFNAVPMRTAWPQARTETLLASRYGLESWHFER